MFMFDRVPLRMLLMFCSFPSPNPLVFEKTRLHLSKITFPFPPAICDLIQNSHTL